VDSPFDANLLAADQAALSGTWVVNEELSDKPEGMKPRGRPDGGGPEGRPGFGGNRPEGHPNVGEGQRPGGPGGPAGEGPGPRGLPKTLNITQTDESVTFAGPDDRSHTLYTDGRVETHELPSGDQIQVQATWSDGALVVVRSGERGTHTETFRLSGDGQQLTVTVQLAADESGATEIRLVYDRA
jgi:hypothetical protein